MYTLSANEAITKFSKLNLKIGNYNYINLFEEILNLTCLIGTRSDFEYLKNYIFEHSKKLFTFYPLLLPISTFLKKYSATFAKGVEKKEIDSLIKKLDLLLEERAILKDSSKATVDPLLLTIDFILSSNKGSKESKDFLISFVNSYSIFSYEYYRLNEYLFEIEFYSYYYRLNIENEDERRFNTLSYLYSKKKDISLVLKKLNSSTNTVKYLFYSYYFDKEKNEIKRFLFQIRASIANFFK